MRQLLQQMKWQFMILHKNNLIVISVVVTVMYALVFIAIKDLGNMDKVLTLLIYNDPAVIGLFFVGLSIIMEKNQQVLSALFVTPINHHVYLISRILSLSILGWACALGMGISILGTSFYIGHFSAGVFGTCVLFSIAGIFVVSYTTEFLLFLLKSIPVLIGLSLPLLNYYNLTDIPFLYYTPMQGSLNLIVNSYRESPVTSELIYGYISIVFWVPVFYFFVFRVFKGRMINT
jgi:fluoroquinolone transport system permease protein